MRPEEPPPPPKCSQFLFQLYLLLISPLGLSRPPPPSLSSWCFLFLIYFYNWLMVSHTETCFIYVLEHESMFKLCSGKSTCTHHQRGQLQEATCFYGKVLKRGFRRAGFWLHVWHLNVNASGTQILIPVLSLPGPGTREEWKLHHLSNLSPNRDPLLHWAWPFTVSHPYSVDSYSKCFSVSLVIWFWLILHSSNLD